ncbi:unnamed protein product [Heterobilharzia americana]|nr:unnamed protein product [Heterobilharzia americana]
MRLNVIVAISENWGIGKCGGLPWRLKKDMAFFKRVTMMAKPGLKNAVIMGRATWESIPQTFKPLKDRINIVVSSTLLEPPPGVHVVSSLDAAVNLLRSEELSSTVDEVFIIGGSRLYHETLSQTTYPIRIYCTHVLNEVDCDTYFPQIDWTKLTKIQLAHLCSVHNIKYTYQANYYNSYSDDIEVSA